MLAALTEPLIAWEKGEGDRLRAEINRVFAQREVSKKRIEHLRAQAAKADKADERDKLRAEIERELESMPRERFAPRNFTNDVTGERLQQLLCEQDGRMSVISDESGIFAIMSGQYSGGSVNLDVFLQGHAGSAMRVDRQGRLAHLDKPAFSFCLAIQNAVLHDVAKTRRFRDSGLLARFCYAVPASNIGQRDVRARTPVPPEVKTAWWDLISDLLAGIKSPMGKPAVLDLSAEARETWLEFADLVEKSQGEGGRWGHISDWTSKLPGSALRIAALLELAESRATAETISTANVDRAVRLAYLLIAHAEAAFRLMGAADVEGDALAVLAWIQKNRLQQFTRREV